MLLTWKLARLSKYKDADITLIKELLENKTDCLIIDVRSRISFAAGHIEGVTNVPYEDLKKRIPALAPRKDYPIYVHCLSGERSLSACELLQRMGYERVTNLGGLIDWPYGLVEGYGALKRISWK